MDRWIYGQLAFARSQTLQAIGALSEAELEIIPEGLNNHMKWNLGHIYRYPPRVLPLLQVAR